MVLWVKHNFWLLGCSGEGQPFGTYPWFVDDGTKKNLTTTQQQMANKKVFY